MHRSSASSSLFAFLQQLHGGTILHNNVLSMSKATLRAPSSEQLGYGLSMKALWAHYSVGNITKEDLEAVLRAHKAAVDAMKSTQRDAAEKFAEKMKNRR